MTSMSRAVFIAFLGALLAAASCRKDSGSGSGPAQNPEDLPPELLSLAEGFEAEKVAGALPNPVKLAFAPDGRLFFNELQTGRIRVIDSNGALVAEPFATVEVAVGGERGLLGLALSPDFESDGFVFVMACKDGPPRQQVIRFTAAGNEGVDAMVLVDGLPQGSRHNGGDILFIPDGTLLVSVGDTGDSSFSQSDGILAGRILRYNPDGSIPADNPSPSSAEWARGIRNTFDLALHPLTGDVLGVENGPDSHDELNFLAAGKNYEWPSRPAGVPDSAVGLRLHDWQDVIAPTGVAVHDGRTFGDEYAGNFFVAGWNDLEIVRLKTSNSASTDVIEESVFAKLRNPGNNDNKLLDVVEGPDGSLYFSTFSAIWRIRAR